MLILVLVGAAALIVRVPVITVERTVGGVYVDVKVVVEVEVLSVASCVSHIISRESFGERYLPTKT